MTAFCLNKAIQGILKAITLCALQTDALYSSRFKNLTYTHRGQVVGLCALAASIALHRSLPFLCDRRRKRAPTKANRRRLERIHQVIPSNAVLVNVRVCVCVCVLRIAKQTTRQREQPRRVSSKSSETPVPCSVFTGPRYTSQILDAAKWPRFFHQFTVHACQRHCAGSNNQQLL